MHFSSLVPLALTGLAYAAPALEKRVSNLKFAGVNEAGAEFGNDNLPGVYGTDYTFPDKSTYDIWLDKGLNTFRMGFQMERLAPDSIDGALDSTYLGRIKEQVSYVTSRGGYILIQPHNFGRYYGDIITDTAAFAGFWSNVASEFKSNSLVIFDTNNEFHDEPGQLVADLNQAAIDAIRSAGATSQYIAVEGNAYTGAWTWTTATGTDGLTNAETMGSLTDPSDKILYEMHQYLDSDGSGTSTTCVSSTIGSERLEAATNWLRENGKKGLIGEYAGAVNDVCEAAIKDMLSFITANNDVWEGAIWWAAGPWWGEYMFSVEPTDGPAYSTYAPIITQYA